MMTTVTDAGDDVVITPFLEGECLVDHRETIDGTNYVVDHYIVDTNTNIDVNTSNPYITSINKYTDLHVCKDQLVKTTYNKYGAVGLFHLFYQNIIYITVLVTGPRRNSYAQVETLYLEQRVLV